MRKTLTLTLALTLIVTIFVIIDISHGQDEEETVIGEIIEMVPEENIIQVGNRNYIVQMVLLDDGSAETPLLGSFGNLKLGSLVEISVGNKNEGFWAAKMVVVFTGEKRENILKEIE